MAWLLLRAAGAAAAGRSEEVFAAAAEALAALLAVPGDRARAAVYGTLASALSQVRVDEIPYSK